LDTNLMGTAPNTQTAYTNGTYQYQLGTGCVVGAWPAIAAGMWVNFIGLIDEPAVYSRTLRLSEVQSIFAAGSNGKSPLTIAPLLLASGSVDTNYSQSLSVSNGTAPYVFSVSSGALPLGMSLSTSGVLSGTPETHGSYFF